MPDDLAVGGADFPGACRMRSARRADHTRRSVTMRRRDRDAGTKARRGRISMRLIVTATRLLSARARSVLVQPRTRGLVRRARRSKRSSASRPSSCRRAGLMGDSIDNLKGVPGIGEKGPRSYRQYGSVENRLLTRRRTDAEAPRCCANFRRASKPALATIHTACPCTSTLNP